MKVKEILKLACMMIGKEQTAAYLSGEHVADKAVEEAETTKLLTAYGMALERTAGEYEPLTAADVFSNAETVRFADFKERPMEIISVKDEMGDDVEFSIKIDGIAFNKPLPSVCVRYRYLPGSRDVESECDYGYGYKITPKVLAYGTAAEYLSIVGAHTAAEAWLGKYERGVRACLHPKGVLVLPKRRWY